MHIAQTPYKFVCICSIRICIHGLCTLYNVHLEIIIIFGTVQLLYGVTEINLDSSKKGAKNTFCRSLPKIVVVRREALTKNLLSLSL